LRGPRDAEGDDPRARLFAVCTGYLTFARTHPDLSADAVALWLGLHGLAHQQSVTVSFSWPPDITERLVVALAHLTDD
jgi:hypothetical protein